MKSAGANMTKFITLPLVGVGALSIKTAADFEAGMSKVQAISGATGDDMQKLEGMAKQLGATTKFSASDAADALSYMGMAGWKTEDMMAGLPGVLDLAAAGGTDLALTSDIVTDGLTGLGLTAKDTGMFVDVMAATCNGSNTSIELMGETLKYVGPVAGTLGINMQDLSLAIGLMGNSGIKGSQAGTALRSGLTNLVKPTDQMKAAMEKYNIELVKNSDGSIDFMGTMENLRTNLGGLDRATKAQALSTIFGKEAMSGWAAIVNASDADFKNLASAIANSDGAAKTMAETMQDNLKGSLDNFESALEAVGIVIGDILIPAFRGIVDWATNALTAFTELDSGTQTVIVAIGAVVAIIGPLLLIGGGLLSMLPGIAAGFQIAAGAATAMNVAILGVPLAVAGVVAVIAGLVTWIGTSSTALGFLQDKFGAFGIFLAATCEAIAGVVQLTFGNMAIIIGTAAKMIGAILTGNFSKVDDIFREGWAKVENNTAQAMSNIAAETSSALELLKSTSADKLGNVVSTFDTAMQQLPNLTKDNASKIAQSFTNELADLDEKSLTILRGTSDTMAVLFEGIRENMDPKDATAKFTANLESMATSGKFNMETIKGDIDNAMKTINSNMLVESEAFKQSATNMFNEFKTASSQGMPEAINNVVSMLGTMNQETVTQLSSMGSSWSQVFQGINLDSGMTTQQMKDTVTNNINTMGLDAGQLISQLRTESSGYMKQMSQDADQNTKQLALSVDQNTKQGSDKGTKNVKDFATNVEKETKNAQQKGDTNTKQYATNVDSNVKSGTDKAKVHTGNLAKNTEADTKKAGNSAKTNIDAGGKAVTNAMSKMASESKKHTGKVASDTDADFKKATKSIQQESTNMYNGAKTSFTKLAQIAKQAGSDAYNGINNSFSKIPGIVSSAVSSAAKNASAHTASFRSSGQSAGQAWIDGFNSKKAAMSTAVANIPKPRTFNVRSAVALSVQPDVQVNNRSIRSFAAVSSRSSNNIASAVTSTLANAASSLDVTSSYKRAGENAANAFVEGLSKLAGAIDDMWKSNNTRWITGSTALETLTKEHNDKLTKLTEEKNKKIKDINDDWYKKEAESIKSRDTAILDAENKWDKAMQEANSKYAKNKKKYNEAKKKADQTYKDAEKKAWDKHWDTMTKANETYYEKKADIDASYAQKEKEQMEKYNSDKEKIAEDQVEASRVFKENLVDIQEKYNDKVQALNEKYINEEKKLNDEYEKIYDSRVNSLMGWSDIFAEIKPKEDVSGEKLMDNLKQQVDIFKYWDQEMNSLAGRVGKDLYDELLKKGPQVHQEIAALNRLSQDELNRYEQLFEEKKRMAEERAKKDTEGERQRIENEIAGLKDKYLEEYEKLGKDMADEVQKQVDTVNKKFGQVPDDLLKTGKDSVTSFIKGMESMKGQLAASVSNIVNSVTSSLYSGGVSAGAGVRKSLEMYNESKNVRSKLLDAISTEGMVTVYNSMVSSSEDSSSTTKSNKRAEDGSKSITINNTYNSPRSASIRELKKQDDIQMRRLAMQFDL